MLTSGQDLGLAFAPAQLRRLAEVKNRVDPENLFRSNRPLPSTPLPGETAPGGTASSALD